ncbi:MAG: sensor histidine kinase [Fusobacterium varium]|uniref:sensor histidine kinase n=1 Tax=Fusobacterium varium TaxID=856 RepID=UPI001F38FFBC|nr:HAMP domain-containing sensor histidine kinase [Fusobacterium varium]MCF2673148.1 HAMP domain-containing histidine kinase [Fusobacterium varium]
MKILGKKFHIQIHKTELLLGILMVLISIVLPNFLLYKNFDIYNSLEKSINFWDKEYLLHAAFGLVFLNTIKSFPIFFSVFLLMDSMDIEINGKLNNTLKVIFGMLIIQIIYFIIYKVYYDMDYYFGKVSMLEMIYLAFHSSNRFKNISLFKRNVVLLLVFTGIQWLDITKYFSVLDYKSTGEIFFDLKNISSLMEADNILNLIGFLFFILFFIFSITLLLVFFEQERRQNIYEKEKDMTKAISDLKLQEVENRYLKEIQYLVHDLKTPLFSIGTLIEILDMQEENEKKKDYYNRIEKSLERCNIMVSEILRDTHKNPIDINKVFNFILSYLSTHKCVEFLSYKNYCTGRKIKVNKIVFSRAITNLIINAYEAFTEYENNKIDLTIKDYKKFILIKIEDSGKGMSENELENAFINGFSTKNSSGVGLNFVKTVMEEHKCKLFICNRKKRGIGVYIVMLGEVLENEK